MTRLQKKQYRSTDDLRDILSVLDKEKFKLDCGHHITLGSFLGNDMTIRNGKVLIITCAQCGY